MEKWHDGTPKPTFYKCKGEHSVRDLEHLVEMYKEEAYQKQLKIQQLDKELYQQRFNNKHNLSIDQQVSDEIQRLNNEIQRLSKELERTKVL